MPLETATYISQLVSTNPAATDTTGQGDDHLRLIKSALAATFPGFTAAALASSQALLDGVVATVNTNGVGILADAGAHFKTNATDAIKNPAAGEIDVAPAGVAALKVKSDGSATISGALSAASSAIAGNETIGGTLGVTGALTANAGVASTTGFTGPGTMPIGASCQWWTDTLPAGYGTYAWLNGQAINRTTYAALYALLGTTYGAGDGVTTFNLPDTRDNTLVGKGTMGATTAAGRITNFVTSTLGNLFGECLHALGITEMPSHDHGGATGNPTTNPVINSYSQGAGSPAGTSGSNGNFANNVTPGPTLPNHVHTITAQGGGSSHNNVQPTIVCNHVMRIA